MTWLASNGGGNSEHGRPPRTSRSRRSPIAVAMPSSACRVGPGTFAISRPVRTSALETFSQRSASSQLSRSRRDVPLRARDSVKLNRSALRDRLPRQMIVKRSKTANARRYWSFSAEMPLSFKLSSVSHTAYREPIGHAGLRGPAARYCFLILRRRRDG